MVEPLQQTPKEPIPFFKFECACQSQKVTYLLLIRLTLCADVYSIWDASTPNKEMDCATRSRTHQKVSTRACHARRELGKQHFFGGMTNTALAERVTGLSAICPST